MIRVGELWRSRHGRPYSVRSIECPRCGALEGVNVIVDVEWRPPGSMQVQPGRVRTECPACGHECSFTVELVGEG